MLRSSTQLRLKQDTQIHTHTSIFVAACALPWRALELEPFTEK